METTPSPSIANDLARSPVRQRLWILGVSAVAFFLPALGQAQAFADAVYDASADELVVTVLYSGTNPDHEFSLGWDPCVSHPDGTTDVTAQLIDSQARDAARQEYRKTVRLSLQDLTCRPARVTLRGSAKAYIAVQVPAAHSH